MISTSQQQQQQQSSSQNTTMNERTIVRTVDQHRDNVFGFKCDLCIKSFSTEHGRSIHLHSCRKKHSQLDLTSSINNPIIIQDHEQITIPKNDINTRLSIWGHHTKEDLEQIMSAIYDEIVFWRKNLFLLPSGHCGKLFISEMTRLINAWNNNSTNLKSISLKALMIMPALLMQKPSYKSKSKHHTASLNRRMDLWFKGDFDTLIKEARAIQGKLTTYKKYKNNEQLSKGFSNLMLKGKVNAALKLLDQQGSAGILPLSDEVLRDLQEKHPPACPADESVLIQGETPTVEPVIFEDIDESLIAKAAIRTKGAAGPSGLDSDGWRRLLISKNYGVIGKDLRTAIAEMAKNLCINKVEIINGKTSLEAYTASKLIPLDKNPGVRPIGIGEVLRRIIGKAVISTIKPEIMKSAGSLQLCAGQEAGCEAATHAMNQIFLEDETDAILLVDASNAFNSINRKVMLHNIKHLCPEMATYAYNSYCTSARLFVQGGKEITSSEGTTQGDSFAMPMYAIGVTPLLNNIKNETNTKIKHAAFADDLAGAGCLVELKHWWDNIENYGPLLGYYPKASKSWLIVKPTMLEQAQQIFSDTNVNITVEGRSYLGGFIGNDVGKSKHINIKLEQWIKQIENLSIIARYEPQAAYSAFVAGFKHKLTYYIRVTNEIAPFIEQLDHIINTKFLPAITEGHEFSEDERQLISLPVRLGGLGIPVFSKICATEHENSKCISAQLSNEIMEQNDLNVQ